MSATAKKIIMAVIIAVIALTALGLGAWGVSMYYSDGVKQTYHIKLARDTVRDDRLMFETDLSAESSEYAGDGYRAVYSVAKGGSVTLNATLFDQYLDARDIQPQYFLAEDLTGKTGVYDGVTLSGGTLTVAENSALETGDVIVVVARAGSKQAAAFIKVE